MSEAEAVKEETVNEVTEEVKEAPAVEAAPEKEEVVTETESETKVEVETKPETKAEPQEEPAVERVVPEAGDYTLPEGVPEHVAQFANENGFTQDQLEATLKQFGGYVSATQAGERKVMEDAGQTHTEKWGEKKEYNLSLVRRALKQNDPEGKLTGMLNESGYGNHPAVLDFFLSIGKSMREGGFLQGAINRPEGKSTAASAMFGKTHPN